MSRQLLDPIPVAATLILFAILMFAAYEVGFRVGRWWQDRTPGEQEGPTGVLVGSLLALMAFVLAIAMGMAADRFDARRGLVLEEATAIRTAYLRAGYQPSPQREQIRTLLREYVPLRVATGDLVALQANIQRSAAINVELWALTEELVETTDKNDLLALFVESVNDVINLHERRLTAGLYARVPESVILLLFGGSILTLGMVGYSAGITRKRGMASAVILVVALSAVTILVVDLDRPRDGFITVNQQPLIDLREQIGAPGS